MTPAFAADILRYGLHAAYAVPSVTAARAYCGRLARTHYENFSVASVLVPRKLLPHLHAVYAYCRWADDLADETADATTAREYLSWWRAELQACYAGDARHPVFVALRETVRRFAIPQHLFADLLTAFEQDQSQKEYATFADLVGYCRNSANPVGRLVLHLYECHDARRGALSDEVCTGLQLANFWQDVARDFAIGRIYLPAEDRDRFGVPRDDIAADRFTPAFAALLKFEVGRTREFFARGRGLLPLLPPRVRMNVGVFGRGGEAILDAIEAGGYDVLSRRPTVSKWGKAKILATAVAAAIRGWSNPADSIESCIHNHPG